MQLLLRLEEFGFFLSSIYLFSTLPFPWWVFPVLLLAPDISMAGYMAGPRFGAVSYNIVHHRALALLLFGVGLLSGQPFVALAGIIMFGHSSLDRALGYGLKFPDSFQHTHLGRIGPTSAAS
jgi:hypothetical protein